MNSRAKHIRRLAGAIGIAALALWLTPLVSDDGPAASPIVGRFQTGGVVSPGRAVQTQAGVPTTAVNLTGIRTGTHADFTRIVLDLGAPQEWFVKRESGGSLRIVIPNAGLDTDVRRRDFAKGLVRSIQPVRRSGGVEIVVVCEPAHVKVRTLTLANPDRLVVDVMVPGGGEGRPQVAQTAPAAPIAGNAPTGGTPSRAAAPPPAPRPAPPPAADRSSPPMPGASVRATETPRRPARPSEADGEDESPELTVVLDPGHGGHDTGAIGPTGLMEKDITLDLALRLRRLLQSRLGIRVRMTRTEDVFVSLQERSEFANRIKADFLVSIHVNGASKRGAVGFETFYYSREPSDSDARASAQRENLVIENNGAAGADLESLLKTTLADMAVTRDMKEASNLAERLLSSLEKILRVENRGVKSGPFYILATAAMPAVLVETAFITNPREERRLQREDYRQRIAHAMYEGIAGYKVRYEQRLGLRSASTDVGS